MKKIRLFKPSVGMEELNNIKSVFKKSWLGYGPLVKNFEEKFAKFIGTKYAVGVNSGTAALHLSILSHNFKKGKKILVPAITFSATAAAVLYNNLKPVFVDVNDKDLNLNIEDLKNKFDKDCVALIAVHFGGHPCEMDKIMSWARKKKIIVIEDCAHTCGGFYKNKKLGNWGDYGCFSFEDKKVITTGDGGMLVTNKTKKLKLLRSLSFHGWDKDPWKRHLKSGGKKSWYYEIKNLGIFDNQYGACYPKIFVEYIREYYKFNDIRISIDKDISYTLFSGRKSQHSFKAQSEGFSH